jgi:uncharacterized protein
MAREGYFILDSDLHLMEPYDLWERYLEGPYKANPPHFFAAHRRPEEEIKVVGMEVQGLEIPAHGRSPGVIASGRELRRRSRARHPHFEVAQAQGFDAGSTLTAMDIEGIDVAVMYGTRGRQVLSHDNLPPDYAAALARAYNNWTHDYCAYDPTRLKFAGQVAMHDIPSAVAEDGAASPSWARSRSSAPRTRSHGGDLACPAALQRHGHELWHRQSQRQGVGAGRLGGDHGGRRHHQAGSAEP